MGDDRNPVYMDGQIMVIRASALGSGCSRAMAALAIGFDNTNLWSLGFIGWTNQAKTSIRSVVFLTNVQGWRSGDMNDFQRAQ